MQQPVEKNKTMMLKCPSCGAVHDASLGECPYCGHVNERVDEKAKREHEWVGLTDEDMEELFLNEDGVRFARYIEAKLREKNHG